MLPWLLSCTITREPVYPDTSPPGDSGDTGVQETGEPLVPVDEDGDGYPRWDTTADAAQADCDDSDPDVTPLTERFMAEGDFLRGDDEYSNASPAGQVWLSAYCIDVYETTNAEFVQFLTARAEAGYPNTTDAGELLFNFEDTEFPDVYPERIEASWDDTYTVQEGYETHPVVEVWFWSAEAYCDWAGRRLPTEAEWEKGARGAEDDRTYPWGDEEPGCELLNFTLPSTEEGKHGEQCVEDTAPVGSYPTGASPDGLLDMAGNVAEWVSDWYRDDYYATGPDVDPTGPSSGWTTDPANPDGYVARVVRGGNFSVPDPYVKVSSRFPEPETAVSNGIGFRCARSL